jgi:molybdenum cofactor cytidylyltransferase
MRAVKNVAAIVLAAGGSTRLGQPKQLLRYEGQTLLRRAVEAALGADCYPVVVVLGASFVDCSAELADLPVELALNANWLNGMGSSLAVGVHALGERAEAVVLTLCDQLHVTAESLRALRQAQENSGARIVASQYAETLGVPALFHRSLYAELSRLDGDEGARRLLRAYRQEVIAVPQPHAVIDIDTLQDCARFGVGEGQPIAAMR